MKILPFIILAVVLCNIVHALSTQELSQYSTTCQGELKYDDGMLSCETKEFSWATLDDELTPMGYVLALGILFLAYKTYSINLKRKKREDSEE